MATANGLWGAPRIHGELMKLGIIVSERTVSRYLPDRRTRRSQTWRTFFANHVANLAFAPTVASSFATGDDDVEASVQPCRPVPPSRDERCASNQWGLIDWPPSLESTSLDWCVAQTQVRRRTQTRFSSGKDPPTSWAVNRCWRRMAGGPYVPKLHLLRTGQCAARDQPILSRWIASASSGSLCAPSGSSRSLLSRHRRIEAHTPTSDSHTILARHSERIEPRGAPCRSDVNGDGQPDL